MYILSEYVVGILKMGCSISQFNVSHDQLNTHGSRSDYNNLMSKLAWVALFKKCISNI